MVKLILWYAEHNALYGNRKRKFLKYKIDAFIVQALHVTKYGSVDSIFDNLKKNCLADLGWMPFTYCRPNVIIAFRMCKVRVALWNFRYTN